MWPSLITYLILLASDSFFLDFATPSENKSQESSLDALLFLPALPAKGSLNGFLLLFCDFKSVGVEGNFDFCFLLFVLVARFEVESATVSFVNLCDVTSFLSCCDVNSLVSLDDVISRMSFCDVMAWLSDVKQSGDLSGAVGFECVTMASVSGSAEGLGGPLDDFRFFDLLLLFKHRIRRYQDMQMQCQLYVGKLMCNKHLIVIII